MADRKISDLTALTAPAAGDYLPIVDISDVSVTNKNKRVTIQSLFQGIPTNVGIGTASPTATLHVRAADSDTAATVLRLEQFNATLTDSARLAVSIDPTNNAVSYDSTGFNSGGHVFLGGGIERMRLTPIGRLGIGTATPQASLDVNGAVFAGYTTANQYIAVFNGDTTNRQHISLSMSGTDAVIRATRNSGTVPNLTFQIESTERMRLDSSGRVGIGTTSPVTSTQIEVVKNSSTAWAANTVDDVYRAFNSNIVTNGASSIIGTYCNYGDGTFGGVRFGAVSSASFSADFVVAPRNAGTFIEALRVTYLGRVGIGTNSPTTLLDVNSNTVRVRTARTPASATATGTTGEICWDANYIYVCTATNTWKRTALSSW